REIGPMSRAPVRVQRACATCGSTTTAASAPCTSCAAEEELVRGKTDAGAASGPLDAASSSRVDAVRASAGERLPTDVQRVVDRKFGLDLSHVRVHADDQASVAARAMSARAFTIGDHVAFDRGAYAPRTPAGLRLLGHELAHVVQQDGAVRRSPAHAGHALASDERGFFEPRFGRSLAHVRVHDDASAARSARDLGAAAFTYGHDVVLGASLGAGTSERRRVLAHELAHVAQTSDTIAAGRGEVGAPDAPAEREADVAAARVLAGQPASISARDATPVIRRMIPAKKCTNDDHTMLILQWGVHIAVIRELLKDAKYDHHRDALMRELTIAEIMMKGYQNCGRVDMPAAGAVGLLSTPPEIGPTIEPTVTPTVEPLPPEPVVEVPPAEAPAGMTGGGLGWGLVISVGAATLQYAIGRAMAPTPTGREITIDDLKQLMQKVDADFSAVKQAADAAKPVTVTAPTPAPSPKADPKVDPKVDTDVDVDEKPDDEPRSCDVKATDCKQVPIPRKGGDSKFTRRHNRCADAVTIPAYKGKDVCINGKAFDAVDASGTLWEVKAHAWSYATIYKNPKMAKKIAEQIADEVFGERKIARACGKEFKVGVRDAGMKAAIQHYLPGLNIVVLKC
ncbi:MAG TPA: DUF4157 domain-containing protein, partial [Kofleriaceae bacterium]|nr:DUF4157 domain-containing protein [Kofleriaceae bacterium]